MGNHAPAQTELAQQWVRETVHKMTKGRPLFSSDDPMGREDWWADNVDLPPELHGELYAGAAFFHIAYRVDLDTAIRKEYVFRMDPAPDVIGITRVIVRPPWKVASVTYTEVTEPD